MTSDEPAHITAGYSILAQGVNAFWIFPQHGHPPLLNVLEAAVFYWSHPTIPVTQIYGWSGHWFSDYFYNFVPYLTPIEQVTMCARLPIILLTVLLGALVFRWGRELWHPRAGLLALLVLTFDPLLLAHGRLATTDVGATMLGTGTLYLAWRWLQRSNWRLSWATGLLLGLTLLAKSSGIIWMAAVAFIVLLNLINRQRSAPVRIIFLQGCVMGGLSFLILWAGYAFTWGPVRPDFPWVLPAPTHWNGFISQALSAEKRWVYALGMRIHGHWWWYFPLAFFIKNPLPLLIGLGIGSVALARYRPLAWTRFLALAGFPLLYFGLSISGGMNIGYRHLMPLHPFFYLLIGGGLHTWLTRPARLPWRRWLAGGLAAWYILGTVRLFPYEIAFFNEIIGGPEQGQYYLLDSNIDWGQGYTALRHYLDEHPGPIPQVAYHFVNTYPSLYGITAVDLPPAWTAEPLIAPFHPRPGRYVLSVTTLQGGWSLTPDLYAWFRQLQPTANLGYSFFLYDIDPPPLQWFSQCTVPVKPLSEDLITQGTGTDSLRRVDFDCTASWLYPAGGVAPGMYALHRYLLPERARILPPWLPKRPQATDPFIARRLATVRLAVDIQRFSNEAPPFSLYESENRPDVPSSTPIFPLSATAVPTTATASLTSPVALQGPLTLLGVTSYAVATGLEVESWWQVTSGPITRSFSVMAHLLTPDGTVLGVADGLGVSPVSLLPGDIFVQRHYFPTLAAASLWFRTGIYWGDDLTRWPVAALPTTDALLVPLTP